MTIGKKSTSFFSADTQRKRLRSDVGQDFYFSNKKYPNSTLTPTQFNPQGRYIHGSAMSILAVPFREVTSSIKCIIDFSTL